MSRTCFLEETLLQGREPTVHVMMQLYKHNMRKLYRPWESRGVANAGGWKRILSQSWACPKFSEILTSKRQWKAKPGTLTGAS